MVTPESGDILVVNIARNIQNVHHLKTGPTDSSITLKPVAGTKAGR
jgi:hypothetical protein